MHQAYMNECCTEFGSILPEQVLTCCFRGWSLKMESSRRCVTFLAANRFLGSVIVFTQTNGIIIGVRHRCRFPQDCPVFGPGLHGDTSRNSLFLFQNFTRLIQTPRRGTLPPRFQQRAYWQYVMERICIFCASETETVEKSKQ